MPGGVADIVEIIVLAARAHALLRGHRPVVRPLLDAGEHILELHHPGIGEQQGRVVVRHQRRGRDDLVAMSAEEVEEARADLVGGRHRRLSGGPAPSRMRQVAGSHGVVRSVGRGAAPPRYTAANDGAPVLVLGLLGRRDLAVGPIPSSITQLGRSPRRPCHGRSPRRSQARRRARGGRGRLLAPHAAGRARHARALRAHRKEFVEPLIAEQGGRVVKLLGDGLLCEFGSAVDAVRCAVLLQTGMAEREAGVSAEEKIRLRIGINLGDVIHEDGDVYGDGVNVAARLEALADPGGICIARNIHNQVKGKLAFHFAPMGPQRLKNIAEPIETWRVLGDGTAVRAARTWGRPRSSPRSRRCSRFCSDRGRRGWLVVVSGREGVEPARNKRPLGPARQAVPRRPAARQPVGRREVGAHGRRDHRGHHHGPRPPPDLFVIARNSTDIYKGKAVDVSRSARNWACAMSSRAACRRMPGGCG